MATIAIEEPANTALDLIAAKEAIGTAVYNPAGEKLGRVEDIMFDMATGRAWFAVLSFGGFLGIGDKHVPLPWSKLGYDSGREGFVIDLDKRVLENAPTYAAGERVAWNDPAWSRRVYEHYGAPLYSHIETPRESVRKAVSVD